MSCQIYCIEDCNGIKYIGSTIQELNTRLIEHRSTKKKHKCSSKKLDLDNCEIKLIETCDISHRFEREKYWINHIDCVNILRYNFDMLENKKVYYDKNKEKIKEDMKEYYLENKDKKKEYQLKHQGKIKEYLKNKRIYQKSWGGDLRADNNNLLKIHVNLFLL